MFSYRNIQNFFPNKQFSIRLLLPQAYSKIMVWRDSSKASPLTQKNEEVFVFIFQNKYDILLVGRISNLL